MSRIPTLLPSYSPLENAVIDCEWLILERLVTCLSPRPCRLCVYWRVAPYPCWAPPPPAFSRSGTSCSFWGWWWWEYNFRNRQAEQQPTATVCGSPGSGPISQEIRVRILLSSSKNSKKNIDFLGTVLWLLYDFLSLKNDVNVPLKSNKQKNYFFIDVLKVTDEKSRIRISIRIQIH